MAIILTGVALIVPAYMKSSTVTTLDVYVRDGASSACDYLNEGVNISDTLHEPLNQVLTITNYSYYFFAFDGIETVENGSDVNITVVISSKAPLSGTQLSFVESQIKEYILRYVSLKPNVKRNGEYLYIGDKRAIITVVVRGETG